MSEAHPAAPGQPAEHPEAVAGVAQDGGAAHAEPSFYGVTAPMFIGLAMIAVIAIMWWKKVHRAIARALDDKIATIRRQLEEAAALRTEAEALKAEYENKARSADDEAKAILERARHEADELVAKAKIDADALIKRRGRMAEEKIAAEERAAVDQLRAAAADAAARAAARLIAGRQDAAKDAALIDEAIGGLGR